MWGLSFGYLFTLIAVLGLLALVWMLNPRWVRKVARRNIHWTCTITWSVIFSTVMAIGGIIFAATIATTVTAIFWLFLILTHKREKKTQKQEFPYYRRRYKQFNNTTASRVTVRNYSK